MRCTHVKDPGCKGASSGREILSSPVLTFRQPQSSPASLKRNAREAARSVTARLTQPPRDVSAMDGYALRAADGGLGARLAVGCC